MNENYLLWLLTPIIQDSKKLKIRAEKENTTGNVIVTALNVSQKNEHSFI